MAVGEYPQAQQVLGDENDHHQSLEEVAEAAQVVFHLIDQQQDAGQHQGDHENVEIGPYRRLGIFQQIVDRPFPAVVSIGCGEVVTAFDEAAGE